MFNMEAAQLLPLMEKRRAGMRAFPSFANYLIVRVRVRQDKKNPNWNLIRFARQNKAAPYSEICLQTPIEDSYIRGNFSL